MLSPLLMAVMTLSPAATDSGAPVAGSNERILVLDFTGLDPAAARATATIAAAVIEEHGGFDVVTAADVVALMDRESKKQNAGCDTDSESCFAELASALGASNVLHGSVASLGSQVLVTVSLFDADAGVSRGRKVADVASLNDVSAATRRLTKQLITEAAPPTPTSPALVWGAVAAGVGVVVAGAGLGTAAWAFVVEGDPSSSGTDKDTALGVHVPASITGLIGVGVVVVGASLVAVGLLSEGP